MQRTSLRDVQVERRDSLQISLNDSQRYVGIERRQFAVNQLDDDPENSTDRSQRRPTGRRHRESEPVGERAVAVTPGVTV